MEAASKLWAITSYFNPVGYRRRRTNYGVFRDRLRVPLLTVELTYGPDFDLRSGDADMLIQLRGADVMWQKERLLNVALDHLPDSCEYVAWLDCDVVFAREDWPAMAIERLQRDSLCQLFRKVHHVGPEADLDALNGGPIGVDVCFVSHDSVGHALTTGIPVPIVSPAAESRKLKRGHAWCIRREIVEQHGFYDRNVVGAGDSCMIFAALGRAEEVISQRPFASGHAAEFRRWSRGFEAATGGRVGFIEGDLFHLWHGDFSDRAYVARHRTLFEFEYDPLSDLALDAAGCWRWASPKYEMHRRVREYFESRCEDGRSLARATGAAR